VIDEASTQRELAPNGGIGKVYAPASDDPFQDGGVELVQLP
jgi:hypothetical protein